MEQERHKAKSSGDWLDFMASGKVLFFALPWLMLLLIAGTIAQKNMGLYGAQKIFFSAWVLWFGPLPLPGTYATLGVVAISLLVKFIFYSPLRWDKAGTILTHLGILVLLIGGMLTAATQREGFLALAEGSQGNQISDYYDRVLSVQKNGEAFLSLPFGKIKKGQVVDLPFAVTVENLCKNCRPVAVKNSQGRKGFAAEVDLRDVPSEIDNETNLSGVTLKISGADDDQNGIYAMMEEIPHTPKINFGADEYVFAVKRWETPLPFSIELKDFKREMHPGTNMARGFSSDVIVHDGTVTWPVTISMNEPLRYKGFTFYQASFSIRPDGELSVLSVVQNKGRIFPYIASITIFAGLLVHLLLRLGKRKSKA